MASALACAPSALAGGLAGHPWGRPYLGCMANAQTHVAQLPNTYLFAHFARGGSPEAVDLQGFAAELVPGMETVVEDAWTTLQNGTPERARDVAAALARERQRLAAAGGLPTGRFSGLLMGAPHRFVRDLEMQLAFYADMQDVVAAVEHGRNGKPEVRTLTASWRRWMEQTGFVDAYGGPVERILHPALRAIHDVRIDGILADFGNWRSPAVRNGIVPRLIAGLADWCG